MKINIGKYPKKGERKVSIHIDDFDVWNLDHTLALIIHPALVKLKEIKHGSPSVDDEDVPEKLKSTSAKPKKNKYDVDSNFHKRWDYVLKEMIFAFDSIANEKCEIHNFCTGKLDIEWIPLDKDRNVCEEKDAVLFEMKKTKKSTHEFNQDKYDKHMNRVKNGLRLFSKYYFGLWD